MKVFGLDFSIRKPIPCAVCDLEHGRLRLNRVSAFTLEQFTSFLETPGEWTAGIDFPFGLPRAVLEDLRWPERWQDYVAKAEGMGKQDFEQALKVNRQRRPPGGKQPLRITDKVAGSKSPVMMHGVPVGKMFFVGAPRLLRSRASILPCRPVTQTQTRVIVEAYPALVARKWVGSQSYKNDSKKKQTADQLHVRQRITNGLRSDQLKCLYGFAIKVEDGVARKLAEEPTADRLDAVMCAIQAAWAYTQRKNDYGIPRGHALEGWIVDPQQLL